MNRGRVFLGIVGLGVFLLGVATVVAPSTAAAVPIEGVVELLGGPYVFVAAFGVVAFVVVVGVMGARAIDGLDEATPPDPEDVYQVPVPGHEFDAFVDSGGGVTARILGNRHERARNRVRRTALSTLIRTGGMSRDEAEAAIREGTWTDDPVAASFLSTRHRPGLGQRLAAAVRGESSTQRGARRAALAVARYDEGPR